MAWIEWHQQVLPISDDEAEIHCQLEPPDSLGWAQDWNFSLDHFVCHPEGQSEDEVGLSLFIELGTLGCQVADWRHLGRQDIIATPDWHARAGHLGPYGHLCTTWLSVTATEPDPASGELRFDEWRADHFRITFSPPTGYLFPCEIEAWLMPEAEFHTGVPLTGAAIRALPQGPPNLRVIALARFARGCITVESGHPDPLATARRRIAQAIALEECGKMHLRWWAEAERSSRNITEPPPPSEQRRCDITFETPKREA